MLSISRDSSGKTVVDVTDCESIKEVKTVKMTNLGLTDFDQQMFSQMKNTEEMDISGNKLDTIPEYISLPKLKRLNCSRNRFTDITFIRQFPNLEEMDIRHNKISFSDHCIACDLCPRLKRVNDQEFNIDKLKEKLENRLKPLISRVWLDHFMSTFDDRMTLEEFEAIGEKFKTMLKHSNINVTKVVMKFKDFKLVQLIDRFLTAIRESSEGTLFGISNCTTERSQKSYAVKKTSQPQTANDIEFVPVTLSTIADTPGESSLATTEASDPEIQDSTVYVLTSEKEEFPMDSDTVYILTEECDNADLSNVVILTENGQVTENGKNALRAIVSKDRAALQSMIPQTPAEQNSVKTVETDEVTAMHVEGRVTKFLPGPIAWGNLPQEPQSAPVSTVAACEPQKAPTAPKMLSPEAKPRIIKPVIGVSAKQPKVVKYWLYDEEIKPLRKAKKPDIKKPSKRPDLSQYIVGPASEFSLASRRATLAAAEISVTNLPDTAAATNLTETVAINVGETSAADLSETKDVTLVDTITRPSTVPEPLAPSVDTTTEKGEVVKEQVVLLDLWSDTPRASEVLEETVEQDETNHVSEATLLLDLSQSRPALHLSETMDTATSTAVEQVVSSSAAIVAAPAVSVGDTTVEDSSTSCSEKVSRVREDPDKSGLRVPPKKRVRFLDEVQTETGEDDCVILEETGNCIGEAVESELGRPSIAEDT